MGETSSKVRMVFDAVAKTRAVYLFDEFDALGGQRSATNDVGEARRVLNSFLQFLEQASPANLVVSATNHPQLLDRALFRRFDDVIEFGLPDRRGAVELIKNRLSTLDTSGVDWTAVSSEAGDMSHADLVRAAESAAKDVLLASSRVLSTKAVIQALADRRRDVHG